MALQCHQIVSETSPLSALERLDALREAGDRVLIVFAPERMDIMSGAKFFKRARQLHPGVNVSC